MGENIDADLKTRTTSPYEPFNSKHLIGTAEWKKDKRTPHQLVLGLISRDFFITSEGKIQTFDAKYDCLNFLLSRLGKAVN